MLKIHALVFVAVFGLVAVSSPATAGITVDQKCRSGKLKATGKKFAAEAKCYAKALSLGGEVSSECLSLAQTKFDEAFAKAGSACQGMGDAVTDKLDEALEDVVGDVGCGDGKVIGDEQCDDGNAIDDDGCNSSCKSGTCGNGIVDTATGEVCDDGNLTSGDGCRVGCGEIELGWACAIEGKPCKPIYGDGLIIGQEECDDRNDSDDDGCSAAGIVEPGWECSAEGQACTPIPGDGIVVGTEECDDGNDVVDDGCSSERKDQGWTCPPSSTGPSVCHPTCGDGLIVGSEECDDQADSCADGCDNRCRTEPGWDCAGEPSVCTAR